MAAIRATMGANGRIVIPVEIRRILHLEAGAEIVLVPSGAELRLIPTAQAVKRAQAMVRRHVRKGRSLVKELRAERRQEADRE